MKALYKKYLDDLIGGYLLGKRAFNYEPRWATQRMYPIDLEFTLREPEKYYRPLDESGLPVRQYVSVGRQYNPTRIAAFGLAHWNRHVASGSQESFEEFLKAADWFAGHRDGRFEYHFDWHDNKAPWISCMSQGEGISVLIRAYVATGDVKYLSCAEKAAEPFALDVKDGGVRSQLCSGELFLEEYPRGPARHVLNGFMYAMIGIHDLATVRPDILERLRWAELVAAVKNNLKLWDVGNWSVYDAETSRFGLRNYCTVTYHALHVTQMKWLSISVGDDDLLTVSLRWEKQLMRPAVRVLSGFRKIAFRLLNPAQR